VVAVRNSNQNEIGSLSDLSPREPLNSVGERLQARAGAFQLTTIKYPAGICNFF